MNKSRIKAYVKKYTSNTNLDTLSEIANEFILEIHTQTQKRGARSMWTIVPIINELSRAWVAFARLSNEEIESEDDKVSTGGFLRALRRHVPKMYTEYIKTNVMLEMMKIKNENKSEDDESPV